MQMKVEAAYLVGTNPDMFNAGKPARILGVVVCTIREKPKFDRLCYHVLFLDGAKEDYVPLQDSSNFQIISQSELDRGKIPKVIR